MSKGRGKNRSARGGASSLPKGLPHRGRRGVHKHDHEKDAGGDRNPFASGRVGGRVRRDALNRRTGANNARRSALARAVERRRDAVAEDLRTSRKANAFSDRRLLRDDDDDDERALARVVRERARRSRAAARYDLNDDDDDERLTHGGRVLGDDYDGRDAGAMGSDDDDGDGASGYYKQRGALDRADTEMHFGGGASSTASADVYGGGGARASLADAYRSRKEEMDDVVRRQKLLKVERQKEKEKQVDTFERLDDTFKDLAALLTFRDKDKEYAEERRKKERGEQTQEEKEMDAWERDVKTYRFDRRVAATDRTKTPEELAKEEADRLHEAETRRLARMNGDFEGDDLSDVEDLVDDIRNNNRTKKRRGDDELDDDDESESDVDDDDESAETDRFGNTVRRPRTKKAPRDEDNEDDDNAPPLAKGAKVRARYRADDQFEGGGAWYDGVIAAVRVSDEGTTVYDVEYDDGDSEEAVTRNHVRAVVDHDKEEERKRLAKRRRMAREEARSSVPFVFEVPTTLEALHDVIAEHATTGADVTLILQRIHAANSVRLDRRNRERMQNFLDVLLRRLVLVGDALREHGDEPDTVGRAAQLDALTRLLHVTAGDDADAAGAVWGRRLGILQRASAKRLRDGVDDAWPSAGTMLLLRTVTRVFPASDRRHPVTTPASLLVGRWLAQCPVRTPEHLERGLLCVGLLLEHSREAKRWAPEASSFLVETLELFVSPKVSGKVVRRLGDREGELSRSLRERVSRWKSGGDDANDLPRLTLEPRGDDDDDLPAAVLVAALRLVRTSVAIYDGALRNAEAECFARTERVLSRLLKSASLPPPLAALLRDVADRVVVSAFRATNERPPLRRRARADAKDRAVRSLAPRTVGDPDRYYGATKEKTRTSELERRRREYRKEHKAVAREIRLDAAVVEAERRRQTAERDAAARSRRNANFAWLEGEQATMNQQVRQGGELLRGGGTGAARRKVKSAQMGIKKGGKF